MADSTILALDIKDKVVAGVLYLESKRSLKVLSAHCCFLDDQELSSDTLALAIAEVVQFCKAGGARCVVSFGAEFFQYRTFHLPFENHKKVRSVVPFEVEDSVSSDEAAFVFDCLLAAGAQGGTDVLAVLVKKDLLQGWLALLSAHNLDPEVVTVSGLPAAFNVCRYDRNAPGSIALLQVGFANATLIGINNGMIKAVRSFAYNLENHQAVHYSAEDRKVQISDLQIARERFAGLAADAGNTLFVINSSVAENPDTWLNIGGPVGKLAECQAVLTPELDTKPYHAEWRRFVELEILDSLSERWPQGALDDALALACCAGRDRESINFRKDEFAFNTSGSRMSLLLKASAAGLLLLVAGVVLYQFFDYQRMQHRRDQLTGEVITLYKETLPGAAPGPEPLNELKVKVNKLRETSGVDSGHDLSLTAVKLLADISARIPADLKVTLERYLYDRKSIRIKGITDNFNTVDTMKKALEQSRLFAEVSIGSATIAPKEQGVRFELKLDL